MNTAETTTQPMAETTAIGAERHRRSPSARMRILGWYLILLAVALAGTFIVQRAFLVGRVKADVNNALDQEVGELRQLAGGINPETGEPFAGNTRAIFDTFLARNVALEGEGVVTIVSGTPYKADSMGAVLARTPLIDEWIQVRTPVRQDAETTAGPVRYLAIPMIYDGRQRGIFVVAVLMADRLAAADGAVRIGALVSGSIFLLASVIAWLAAGTILKPLRTLSEMAQSINDSDLSQRIPVEGDDEIAELGRTFNSMLDRLEDAFDAQRNFVDDAGHELRTPITVIRGNLELMGDDPTERRETVALVTAELDRMSRIVDDLLVLAKAEQPDFVRHEYVDLGELTRDLATKAQAFDGRTWEIDSAEEAVIFADEQRITQAVMNLMRNAAEHTPREARVAVGSRVEGDKASIWVRDGGPGIPREEQERLFQRFARGQSGRRATGGAGLGLAIVKAIVDAHGGTIRVASTPGLGAMFTIELPAGPPTSADEAEAG